jgi:hypothetical protein
MAARRKPLQGVTPLNVPIDPSGLSQKDGDAIEKDRCLIEAAMAADHVIITRDDALQRVLAKTPQGSTLLKQIKWVNPVSDGTAVLSQL